jgi:hypothetical protein
MLVGKLQEPRGTHLNLIVDGFVKTRKMRLLTAKSSLDLPRRENKLSLFLKSQRLKLFAPACPGVTDSHKTRA